MEKSINERRVRIPIEKYPQFGTSCREKNDNFFCPFYPTDSNNIQDCYLVIEPNYKYKETFYVFINFSEEGNIATYKIELKLKNIEQIETINEDYNQFVYKTFFFSLSSPPKIFKKINKNKTVLVGDDYINKFNNFNSRFSFTNHYHFIFDKIDKNGNCTKISENLFVENTKLKKQTENTRNEISFEIDEINDFTSFVRVDSILSTQIEFTNFYLLNLIMQIKIKFFSYEEFEDFCDFLKLGRLMLEKPEISLIPDKEKMEQIDVRLRKKTLQFYKIMINLHFNLQFSILCLITQKRLNIFSFDTQFLERLAKMSCEDQNTSSILIEHIIKEQSKINSHSNILEIFDTYYEKSFKLDLLSTKDKESQNINSMKTRTIEITPSIIYYKIPIFEKLNHILRKYAEYNDNFMKVNFQDEENNKIYFSSQTMWVMINFLRNIMLNYVTIGSRKFKFLSASNSQMKNSSYWFFNLEGTRFTEVEQIIKELGDFTKETNIHKNAARRGQCLSTTSHIKHLNIKNIKLIDDIERNNFCFSDGNGQISLNLAIECAAAFKLDYASCYQIRIGGIKGIVSVNPELPDDLIIARPSMIKFESEDTDLGVIRCSNFSQGYLNRQIITLLNSLGVPSEIFYTMLNKDLIKYEQLINDPNAVLGKYFHKYNIGDLLKKCYFFMPALNYYAKEQMDIKSEPFLSSVVLNLAISKVKDLKNKGKIIDKNSAVLIGVIDETNSLQEGEVFIQIKKDNGHFGVVNKHNLKKTQTDGSCFPLNDMVIVTKNPCLHPGDIKFLKAVSNLPLLSHMVNVIVFSSKGKRPVQNEISGGDLDGDSYFVSWNSKLINNVKYMKIKSMDETKGTFHALKNKDIKMKDIVNSYIDYMKYDTVALISNFHSAHADYDVENGAFNEKCLKLADLFSIAIDAPKHGNFVRMEELVKNELTLKQYPDFLDLPSFPNYESPGVLGQLYRQIDLEQFFGKYEFNEYVNNYLENYVLEFDYITDNCHKYIVKAFEITIKYSNEIKNLMTFFKVFYETEFFLCEDLHDKKRSKQLKQNDFFTEISSVRDNYKNMIMLAFNNDISRDVASALYVSSYLNNKSIIIHRDFYLPKFGKLIDLMINNGILQKDIAIKNKTRFDIYENYNNYDKYAQAIGRKTFKEYSHFISRTQEFRGCRDIINTKRLFSLPWLIKEVRDKILRKI